jgi:hypothetical protein
MVTNLAVCHEMLINEVCRCGAEVQWKFSALCGQFCCEPKAALNNKAYFYKREQVNVFSKRVTEYLVNSYLTFLFLWFQLSKISSSPKILNGKFQKQSESFILHTIQSRAMKSHSFVEDMKRKCALGAPESTELVQRLEQDSPEMRAHQPFTTSESGCTESGTGCVFFSWCQGLKPEPCAC